MRHPKRRANLLYRLRKKGVACNTKQQTIFIPFEEDPFHHIQAKRLCEEFHFSIQLILI